MVLEVSLQLILLHVQCMGQSVCHPHINMRVLPKESATKVLFYTAGQLPLYSNINFDFHEQSGKIQLPPIFQLYRSVPLIRRPPSKVCPHTLYSQSSCIG